MRLLVPTAVAAGLLLCVAPVAAASPAIPLNPGQETTTVVSDAHGFFTYTVDSDELCYTLTVQDLTAAPVAAHIHDGVRRVAGPIVVGLATPPAATGSVSACVTATEGGEMTPAELAAITANPAAFYVNVHTPANMAGEIRGQLKK